MSEENLKSLNFVEEIIEDDLKTGKHHNIRTRFPPEPNGYLHIGHAKAICLNFGLTQKYGGTTNLRFDDTNPTSEGQEYIDAIKRDIKWLGFEWDNEFYASDYFDDLYEMAVKLIHDGLAYVDESDFDTINAMKGDTNTPGTESPYRNRPKEESLKLFEEMKEGKHPEGSMVLRAKIDMSSPNMHLRDPIIYRIKYDEHVRTGKEWNIYPMYDMAHGQSDAIENITHSLCSIEFENHRPLYNWLIQKLDLFPSRQIEFSRMHLAYTVVSKRKLLQLVEGGYVNGWDDPRMPTISGMRRRGYTPESIRDFCDRIGLTKRENLIDYSLLEYCVREHLNKIAPRVMAVINPLKLVITNYPEGKTEHLSVVNNPEDPDSGERDVLLTREIYIEKEDFMIDPPKKYFRLAPGKTVRLKSAYIIHCDDYKVNEETGEVEEVYATYYPDSKSGHDTSGIKPKGTLHWVSAEHSKEVELRMYERLFTDPEPDSHEGIDFKEFINKDSLEVINHSRVETSLADAKPGDKFQFFRMGYFVVDPDSDGDKLVFNRTVSLKSAWKNPNEGK